MTHTKPTHTKPAHKKAAHRKIEELLALADVRINGERPWDMQVHDERLYQRILAKGTLGLGEAYMDGWWDCAQLDQFISNVMQAELRKHIAPLAMIWPVVLARLFNLQSMGRAFQVGEAHYDLGNDLFERMLDPRLTYTCGYWKEADNLNAAQEAKLDLVCRKIGLKAGQKVLDIGCGWGSFAGFAAERYGAEVFGVTVSREQGKWVEERYAGLPVKALVSDYRALAGQFDHVVSLGMFEHVGRKNYAEYMRVARRCLKPDGLFLLHTIGRRKTRKAAEPWSNKYIFPNAQVPSMADISVAIENVFVLEDLHNFGKYYDSTLMAWHANFERHWPEIADKYGERFHRMWRYFLLTNAGAFRSRRLQLWQLVLSPEGVPDGYRRTD
ncbi:MAG: cyclopropane fatty acyl phospholipid synthase [Pseudomonadales bacterium]|nr:cyclopropane fatty acyl phospholipid synthase [Pseudomonadales bacterium]